MRRSGPKSGSGSPQISTRAGDRAWADLLFQLPLVEVGRYQHRALGLVALVDQRVELLQHPVAALLGAEVVDVEQVDGGEPLEESEIGVTARLRVVGTANAGQQLRQRVDRDRAIRLQRRLGDQHRQRRLAGAGVTHQPEAAARLDVRLQLVHPGAHHPHHHRLNLRNRGAIEGDASKLRRDHRGDALAASAAQALLAALAGARHVFGAEDPAGAVADTQRAGLPAERLAARHRH